MRNYTTIKISKTFELSVVAICTVNPKNDEIEYCNPAFTKLMQKAESDLVGVNYVTLLGEASRITPALFEELSLNNSILKRSFEIAQCAFRKNGQQFQISYTSVNAFEENFKWLILSVIPTIDDQNQQDTGNLFIDSENSLNLAKSNILLSELNFRLKT